MGWAIAGFVFGCYIVGACWFVSGTHYTCIERDTNSGQCLAMVTNDTVLFSSFLEEKK